MKILITGGAGFIGSHLCDVLINSKHEITVVDNLMLGSFDNLRHLENYTSFSFYNDDILNLNVMKNIFSEKKFDVVFHLAANSDIAKSLENPLIDFNNTFMTTFNILSCMREYNVKNIVFASTSAIYGDTNKKITEDYGPLFPASHYGASKLSSEAFISSFAKNYGLTACITRFPNVVGERATHGVILDFIKKLKKNPSELEVLGDGEQYKPYLYVKDLVDAILFIWSKQTEEINYFNIGVESRTKVKDIARMVIEEMELKASIRYTGGSRGWIGDVPEFDYSLDKLHNLGWKARFTSDEAVRISIRKILG